MRRTTAVFILLVSLAFSSLALNLPLGPTARSAGMGGVGIALSSDMSASYFNPAGILEGGRGIDLTLGAATANLSKIVNLLSSISDPANLFSNNYTEAFDLTGSLTSFSGLAFNKIGLSGYALGNLRINKEASSIAGTLTSNGGLAGAVTLGTSFPLPFYSALNLHLAANIKNVYLYQVRTEVVGLAGTLYAQEGTGLGYDLGTLTTLSVPVVGSLKFGLVARDLFESINFTRKTGTYTFDATGKITSRVEANLPSISETQSSTLGVGIGAQVPLLNLTWGLDIESIGGAPSITHLGAEFPLTGFLTSRAGLISGSGTSYTTAGLSLGILDAALIIDNNNSANNQVFVEISLGR